MEFLELDSFCPELCLNKPVCIVDRQLQKSYVTNCEFISKYNLYVCAVYDKTSR